MARLFDDAATEYALVEDNLGITGYPYTLACWFNTDDDTISQGLMWVGDKDSGVEYGEIQAAGAVGDAVSAANRSTSDGFDAAYSSTGFTAGAWHHACGVFTNSTSRAAFIDGGSKGTNASENAPDAVYDRFGIGARLDATASNWLSGHIAEAAVWNMALSDDDVAQLGAGYSPLFVRPESLVAYWPLVRDLVDRLGTVELTPNGTTVSAHVPILNPAPKHIGYTAAVVGANAPIGHLAGSLWGPLAGPIFS